MTRTMFESRGFRPGAQTLGHGHIMAMGQTWQERIQKYSERYLNPVPELKVTTPTIVAPEPTILGIPRTTALVGGAAIVGIGLLAAIFG
jgi:hypothetical protein